MKHIKTFTQLNEGRVEKKPLEFHYKELGDDVDAEKLAEYCYDNYDYISGWPLADRNDEDEFPEEFYDMSKHYGIDADDFQEAWNMNAEMSSTGSRGEDMHDGDYDEDGNRKA